MVDLNYYILLRFNAITCSTLEDIMIIAHQDSSQTVCIACAKRLRNHSYFRAMREQHTHREENPTSIKTRTERSMIGWIARRANRSQFLAFDSQSNRVLVSYAAGPPRRSAVPMSHQRLVERPRSRFRPCASTTGT